MKKINLVFILLLMTSTMDAQINLVKNPGFESYNHLPNGFDQIKYANFWSPSDTVNADTVSVAFYPICSPEFCYQWDSAFTVGVPWGEGYYHYPHSGKGMAEVIMFCNSSALDTGGASYLRDYLQGRLYTTLIAGQMYCVSFFVTLEQLSAFSINHIGAYLDDGSMDTARWCAWPQTSHIPQVYETSIITDTLNWTKIEGSFTATGTERFITIGNFFDSAHTATIPTNFSWAIGAGNDLYTWYLVDDVSVIPIDAVANAGHGGITSLTGDSVQIGDTTGYLPCYWYSSRAGSGIWSLIDSNIAGFKVHPDTTTKYVIVLDVCGHITTDTAMVWVAPTNLPMWQYTNVVIYPNPAHDILSIQNANGCEVTIYDMVGSFVKSFGKINKVSEAIDINSLGKGVYTIEVTKTETGMRVVKKVIKE